MSLEEEEKSFFFLLCSLFAAINDYNRQDEEAEAALFIVGSSRELRAGISFQ